MCFLEETAICSAIGAWAGGNTGFLLDLRLVASVPPMAGSPVQVRKADGHDSATAQACSLPFVVLENY
ncbi:MAG: hypothetical protein DIU65_05080 [Proteobacteria bacterium]|nr:MAG: hypothetical protein DIU65_05080 [Pseudomonadota bacterium]